MAISITANPTVLVEEEGTTLRKQEDNTLITANSLDLAILQGVGADGLMADNFAFI